jgi:hypothetical protein
MSASGIFAPFKRFAACTLRAACITLSLAPVFAEEPAPASRQVDMRIVVDASSSLARGKTGAINWLCDTIVDRTLQNGDFLYLVVSRETDTVIFDGPLGDTAQKDALKEKIRALEEPDGQSGAARAVQNLLSRKMPGRAADCIPVTILVCGPDVREEADFLRYSRTENFAYWRAITVAENGEADVNRALRKALP